MPRAAISGIKLTREDAALIKGMLYRGDRQHDIASWFGVNGGRVAEISSRTKFADVLMQKDRLPPPGPYLTGKQTHEAKIALNKLYQEMKRVEGDFDSEEANKLIQKSTQELGYILSSM